MKQWVGYIFQHNLIQFALEMVNLNAETKDYSHSETHLFMYCNTGAGKSQYSALKIGD